MCGIVGYIGHRKAYDVLVQGLHRLEYRGYDSAGVALVKNDGSLQVYKSKGKVADLPDAARLHIPQRNRHRGARAANRLYQNKQSL